MRWNFRPSKPQAVFGGFVGAGMLVVGITTANKNVPFLIFWCAVVVGITAMNLWAAFAKGDSLYRAESSDGEPPRPFGQRTERTPDS